MSIENLKNTVLATVKEAATKALGQKPKGLNVDYPPSIRLGDFTVACFTLTKQFDKSAAEIAKSIASEIMLDDIFLKVQAIGPYINFKVDNAVLFGEVCREIIEKGDGFGDSSEGKDQRVMVEYLSPNTNKPLHLGHIRNGVIGMAIYNLLEASGYKVIKASLINDRGVHICKSMLAWQKWADGTTPESKGIKGDHFVGNWYVRYSQEAEKNVHLKEEIQEMLQKWEAGDPAIVELWKTMNNWVYDGFTKTYQKLGLEFDVFYYESNTYKLGKDILQNGLKSGVFMKIKDGAVVVNLPTEDFGTDRDGSPKKITLLRPDGTSVYITQDLGTAKLKFDEYRLDRSIYVVGSEQDYHLKCLFKILEMIGFKWAKNCYHLSYSMVYLPEGKMKSREGKIVDADDLIGEMEELATREIKKRNAQNMLFPKEIEMRAAKIGMGAIKFYLLRVHPQQDIRFDPEESISFDGFTGPYCQYSYARAGSILRKAKDIGITIGEQVDFSLLGNQDELLLVRKLAQFPEQLQGAARSLNPMRIVFHIYELAQAFNQFYQTQPVIRAEDKKLIEARLQLVEVTKTVLKKGLNVLGVEILEVM